MNTSFADTILNINVTGMLVRIDIGTVVRVVGKDGQEENQATVTQQIVMPMEGFAQSFSVLEHLVNKLVTDGVLKREPQSSTPNQPTNQGPITLQ